MYPCIGFQHIRNMFSWCCTQDIPLAFSRLSSVVFFSPKKWFVDFNYVAIHETFRYVPVTSNKNEQLRNVQVPPTFFLLKKSIYQFRRSKIAKLDAARSDGIPINRWITNTLKYIIMWQVMHSNISMWIHITIRLCQISDNKVLFYFLVHIAIKTEWLNLTIYLKYGIFPYCGWTLACVALPTFAILCNRWGNIL